MKGYIWITGASSGIGKALTIEFLKRGLPVLATARRIDILEEMKKCLSANLEFMTAECDVTQPGSIDKCLYEFKQRTGGQVACLVNNAGITSFRKVVDDSWETMQAVVNTNLMGAIYAIRQALPDMMEANAGTVINILSIVTKKIFTNSSIYAASKAGLEAYSNVLREEMRRYNINVLNIYPGATETAIWNPKVLQANAGRMMKPEDVAIYIADLYINRNTAFPEELSLRPIGGDL